MVIPWTRIAMLVEIAFAILFNDEEVSRKKIVTAQWSVRGTRERKQQKKKDKKYAVIRGLKRITRDIWTITQPAL